MGGKIKIDLQKYSDAIRLIKKMAESGTPIKKTEFLDKYQLTKTTFRIMETLGIIKEKKTDKFGGTIFLWIYNQPSNETDSKVALRVTEKLQEENRSVYTKYSTPEWKKKQEEKKRKKMLENFRETEGRQKVVQKIHIENHTTVVSEVPQEVIVIPIVETPIEDIVGLPAIETPAVTSTKINKESFEIHGEFTKNDVISKVIKLVEDKGISSISIELNYK